MPPSKRAVVPANAFGPGPKVLDKLTGRAQTPVSEEVGDVPEPDAALPTPEATGSGNTAVRDSSTTVPRHIDKAEPPPESADGEGADDSSTREKVTFYLRPDQVEKLDELVITYKRRTGQRTNRNALVRLLIDRIDINLLLTDG
ncbi:MAG: hypothetical protein WCG26_04295 [Chloroflexales bacterium]